MKNEYKQARMMEVIEEIGGGICMVAFRVPDIFN